MILLEFQNVLQAYYAPAISLIFFAGILLVDQLLSRREKYLFFLELIVVGVMILTTWVDICTSTVVEGDVYWRIRAFTSTLQFALAPVSPLLLGLLYRPGHRARSKLLFYLPVAINFLLCMTSLWTGLVTHVDANNIYNRGPLYPLPFLASGFYLVNVMRFASRRETAGRRAETKTMMCITAAVTLSSFCEVTMHLHCMLWSTTTACLELYFLVMTTKKVLYDPMTGAYSRMAYDKRLASIHTGRKATLAMVDMNGLKAINDHYGHAAGDQAIIQISQTLLFIPMRGIKIYRYGGDEFVLIANGCVARRLEEELELALNRCGSVEGVPLSFAYGIKEYQGGDLNQLLEEMDGEMYRRKAQMKHGEDGHDFLQCYN